MDHVEVMLRRAVELLSMLFAISLVAPACGSRSESEPAVLAIDTECQRGSQVEAFAEQFHVLEQPDLWVDRGRVDGVVVRKSGLLNSSATFIADDGSGTVEVSSGDMIDVCTAWE